MNIVIPMAGRGSRLRPHTLTVPKPLVPVAGKPMVQRLVEDLINMAPEKVENIGFIIGPSFEPEVPGQLTAIAEKLGAKAHISTQESPEGTAHAMLCAKELLVGKTIIAFADTLFDADYKFDTSADGVIMTQKVEDPRPFGVVELNNDGHIINFVEKPQEFVSDLAIIGIYYFNKAEDIRAEMQYLIDNDIREKGEYQLTNALEAMKQKGAKFGTGQVTEWLDCGNKNATVYTNQRILEIKKNEFVEPASLKNTNSIIVQPCFIGENVNLENSVVGPHVSLGDNCIVKNSVVKNSLIQHETIIENKVLDNTMLGSKVKFVGNAEGVSLGDFTEA